MYRVVVYVYIKYEPPDLAGMHNLYLSSSLSFPSPHIWSTLYSSHYSNQFLRRSVLLDFLIPIHLLLNHGACEKDGVNTDINIQWSRICSDVRST